MSTSKSSGSSKLLLKFIPSLRWRDDSGAIAPIFGASISLLALILAIAVEVGRWAIAQNELQAALDAAVLAGAKNYQDQHNSAAAIAVAQQAFAANRGKSRFGAEITENITFGVEAGNSLQARGTAEINTILASIVGRPTLPLLGVSGATNRATVTNSDFELSLMLDITGSMCADPPDSVTDAPCTGGTKLQGMKTAAVNLVEKMLGSEDLRTRVRVAVVPFSDGVRLTTTMQAAVAGTKPTIQTLQQPYTYEECTGSGRNRRCETKTAYNTYYYHPTDCVAERSGANAYTDAAPGPNQYLMHAMQRRSSAAASASASEMGCSLGTSSTITPLTNDKAGLVAKINALAAKGGTAGHLGTAWAWYTLSPKWANVFPGTANDPAPYVAASDKTLRKIAVLMTDGEYNNQFSHGSTAYAQSCANQSAATRSCGYKVGTWAYTASANGNGSAAQALALCAAMKAAPSNIEIYTVGYAVNDTAKAMLRQCASSDKHAFTAETADALALAFDGIAQRVLALYLSQ